MGNCNKKMLEMRGIKSKEDACKVCSGTGVRTYANTTTWRGGIGGQALTIDVCDKCWGTGDKTRTGANLRNISVVLRSNNAGSL